MSIRHFTSKRNFPAVQKIVHVEGCYQLVRPDNSLQLIMQHGRPVCDLLPGWFPVGLLDRVAPYLFLELAHVAGHHATWFLDENLHFVTDQVDMLPDKGLNVLLAEFGAALEGLIDRLIGTRSQDRMVDPFELALINPNTRRRLIERCIGHVLPAPVMVVFPEISKAGDTIGFEREGKGPFHLSVSALQTIIDQDLQGLHIDFLMHGRYAVPGIVSGLPAHSDISLLLRDRLTAYSFSDPESGLVFLICNTDNIMEKEIFIPLLNCTIGQRPGLEANRRLIDLLLALSNHPSLLDDYIAAPKLPVNVLTPFPGSHMGHSLWNEMSGLDRVRRLVPSHRLPLVCVQNSDEGTEIWGPIDAVMPEFIGRVHRFSDNSLISLTEWVYHQRLTVIRAYDKHVTRKLASDILREVEGREDRREHRVHAERMLAEGRTPILLGLRVHSRTVSDQVGLFAHIIDGLVRRIGPLLIIVDGTNARLYGDPSTDYGAFGPSGDRPAVLDELGIILALRRRFHSNPSIRIVGTVGTPIWNSLFWASRCAFFVAMWGAGLAKYRWVCNLPGLVLTNRHNLDRPEGDLNIYHTRPYMDNPTWMQFIDASSVTDEDGGGFYSRFRVDSFGLDQALDCLVAALAES